METYHNSKWKRTFLRMLRWSRMINDKSPGLAGTRALLMAAIAWKETILYIHDKSMAGFGVKYIYIANIICVLIFDPSNSARMHGWMDGWMRNLSAFSGRWASPRRWRRWVLAARPRPWATARFSMPSFAASFAAAMHPRASIELASTYIITVFTMSSAVVMVSFRAVAASFQIVFARSGRFLYNKNKTEMPMLTSYKWIIGLQELTSSSVNFSRMVMNPKCNLPPKWSAKRISLSCMPK